MKKNIGTIDKVVRLALVALIITLYFTHLITGTAAVILGSLSAILALTSIISFCPLYIPLGITTVKKR
jgi:hypothetical protein